MKVAIIGYGKMGKEIEQMLLQRGHECVLRITSSNLDDLAKMKQLGVEIAIEFSHPEAVLNNLKFCINNHIPVVTGTTGWYQSFGEIKNLVQNQQGALFYATNFSIGVNVFFQLNKTLTKLMENKHYEPSIWEEHHVHKKDHPSGTGITLAEGILKYNTIKSTVVSALDTEVIPLTEAHQLSIISSRKEEVPGTHIVSWTSQNDKIEIKHEAFNRKGFAEGAVVAAEWLVSKKGIFNMDDLLGTNE